MSSNLQEITTSELIKTLESIKKELDKREHNNNILPLLVFNLLHLHLKEPENNETKLKILYLAQLIHKIEHHNADLLEWDAIQLTFKSQAQLMNQVLSIQNQDEIYNLIISNLKILKIIETKHLENIYALENNCLPSKNKKNYELIQKISSNLKVLIEPLFLLSIMGSCPLIFAQYFFIPYFSLALFSLSCILIGLGCIALILDLTTLCLDSINQKNVFQKAIIQEKNRFFKEHKSTWAAQESNLQDICKVHLVCLPALIPQ